MDLCAIDLSRSIQALEALEENKAAVLNLMAKIQAILNTSQVSSYNKELALGFWHEIQMCLRYQLNIAKAEFDNACKECKVEDDFYPAIYTAIYDLQKIIKQRMVFSYSEETLLSNMNLLFFKFKAFLHDSCSR